MVLLLLFMAAYLLYGKSKYFPATLRERNDWLRKYPREFRLLAYLQMVLALGRLIFLYDGFTGTLIWLYALMFVFGSIIIALPVIFKS
ncbi:MAG: hypothetical protein AAGA62_07250 [Bacteroidota bacterium]